VPTRPDDDVTIGAVVRTIAAPIVTSSSGRVGTAEFYWRTDA